MNDQNLIVWLIISLIPQIDIMRVYYCNIYSEDNRLLKRVFQSRIEEVVQNIFSNGLKLTIISFLISGTVLQASLDFFYHRDIDFYQTILCVEAIYIILQIQHFNIVYYDSRTYGSTQFNTKINFFVTLLSQLIVFLLIIMTNKYDTVCKLVSYIRLAVLGFLILVLIASPKDYTMKVAILAEYTQMKLQRTFSSFEDNRINIYEDNSTLTNNNPNQKQSSIQDSFLSNPVIDDLIEKIFIKTFKESQKYEKRTIIYQISYKLDGQEHIVYRSFREFLGFHLDLQQEFPDEQLPAFPTKKNQQKFLNLSDIQQRLELLDSFLKAIIIKFNKNTYLRQFLNTNQDTPQYKGSHNQAKKIKQAQAQARSNTSNRHATCSLLPDTIWEGQDEEEEDSINDDERSKQRRKNRRGDHSQLFLNHLNADSNQSLTNSPLFNNEEYKTNLSRTCENYQEKDQIISQFNEKDPQSPNSGNISF